MRERCRWRDRTAVWSGVFGEVAGGQVAWCYFGQGWFGSTADLLCLPAPCVEAACGWRVEWAGHVAGEADSLTAPAAGGIGGGHRRHEGDGVGVMGLVVELVAAGQFDDFPEVHDRYPVGGVPHH